MDYVSRTDKYRALLSEFVPYEVPLIFTEAFFYRRAKKSSFDSVIFKEMLKPTANTIPFRYTARVSEATTRELDLVHPSAQLRAVDFLDKYSGCILDRCAVSKFSIRKPVRQAHHYYEPKYAEQSEEVKSDLVDGQRDGFDTQYKSYVSWFAYDRYQRLYKFLDSEEFADLEATFKYQVELDISKCFYNIYTHSIAWAVKDKRFAKSTTQLNGFEAEFDRLMQSMNYKETNGIVVGPEISRIFAEIILQRIDAEVEARLKTRWIYRGRDYDIRRYIDNYYLFLREDRFAAIVVDELKSLLASYKLYLNESKTEYRKRPFLSSQSLVVADVKEIMTQFFADAFIAHQQDEWRQESYQVRPARRRQYSASSLIARYRQAIYVHGADIDSVAGLALGIIRKRVQVYAACPASSTSQVEEYIAVHRFVDDVCKVIAYILRTSLTSRSIDRALQTIVLMQEKFEEFSCPDITSVIDGWVDTIFRKLFVLPDENTEWLSAHSEVISKNQTEFSCFIVVMRHLAKSKPLPESFLLSVWRHCLLVSRDAGHFPYWLSISVLYYIQCDDSYRMLRRTILGSFLWFLREGLFPKQSELLYAFMDFGAYPGFTKLEKAALFEACMSKLMEDDPKLAQKISGQDKQGAKEQYLHNVAPWFVNWSLRIDVLSELAKRELRFGY